MTIATSTAKKENKKGGAAKKNAPRAGGPDSTRTADSSKVKKGSKGVVRSS